MPDRTEARVAAWALAAMIVLLGLSGCASTDARRAAHSNPLAGQLYYVNPHSPAAEQARVWRAEGKTSQAAAMEQLAAQPTATWLSGSGEVATQARSATLASSEAGRSALLVAYYIPGRDCGGFSAGGASSTAAYRTWIGQLAGGIGPRSATVILEPDAVAQAVTGCASSRAARERYALLRYAVRTLKAQGHVTVYIDAGNPGWIQPASRLVKPLRRAGVATADGFALNVANFYATQAVTTYGNELSSALGGVHYVIDTGRNGRGPDTNPQDEPKWCNPPGRAIGTAPTTSTGSPAIDAYLWIKQPGTSDGSCRPGDPPAGQWWPQYALELVQDAG